MCTHLIICVCSLITTKHIQTQPRASRLLVLLHKHCITNTRKANLYISKLAEVAEGSVTGSWLEEPRTRDRSIFCEGFRCMLRLERRIRFIVDLTNDLCSVQLNPEQAERGLT